MLKRIFSVSFLLVFFFIAIVAQDSANPFELSDRTQNEVNEPRQSLEKSNNPFDLQADFEVDNHKTLPKNTPTENRESRFIVADQGTSIGISLLLLVPLALLLTLFRGVFNDFLESAYRDRKFNQFFRRMNSMWVVPNLLLYLFFFLSTSVFTFLTLSNYGNTMFDHVGKSLGFLMVSIGGFFVIKHAVVFFLGDTFDVKNESRRYSLLILTFNIILGVFLTPFNLLLLLGPEGIKGTVIVLGLILCVGMALLLTLRSLSVSNRLLLQDSLHFFMYLCTIEIAPLFIVAKLLT